MEQPLVKQKKKGFTKKLKSASLKISGKKKKRSNNENEEKNTRFEEYPSAPPINANHQNHFNSEIPSSHEEFMIPEENSSDSDASIPPFVINPGNFDRRQSHFPTDFDRRIIDRPRAESTFDGASSTGSAGRRASKTGAEKRKAQRSHEERTRARDNYRKVLKIAYKDFPDDPDHNRVATPDTINTSVSVHSSEQPSSSLGTDDYKQQNLENRQKQPLIARIASMTKTIWGSATTSVTGKIAQLRHSKLEKEEDGPRARSPDSDHNNQTSYGSIGGSQSDINSAAGDEPEPVKGRIARLWVSIREYFSNLIGKKRERKSSLKKEFDETGRIRSESESEKSGFFSRTSEFAVGLWYFVSEKTSVFLFGYEADPGNEDEESNIGCWPRFKSGVVIVTGTITEFCVNSWRSLNARTRKLFGKRANVDDDYEPIDGENQQNGPNSWSKFKNSTAQGYGRIKTFAAERKDLTKLRWEEMKLGRHLENNQSGMKLGPMERCIRLTCPCCINIDDSDSNYGDETAILPEDYNENYGTANVQVF